MRNVHHPVAHAEEVLAHERLCEEIGDVLGSGHERNTQPAVFYAFAGEVMPAVDVLCTRMMFGIISQVDSRPIVHLERWRLRHVETEFTQER